VHQFFDHLLVLDSRKAHLAHILGMGAKGGIDVGA
jgi:hypothetical protein